MSDNTSSVILRQRLMQYIAAKGMTQAKFCQNLGLKPNYISSIRLGIRQDKLMQIAETYPDLNISWLITGRGNIFNEGYEGPEPEPEPQPSATQQENALLRERVAELKAQRDHLQAKLDAKDAQIETLTNALISLTASKA